MTHKKSAQDPRTFGVNISIVAEGDQDQVELIFDYTRQSHLGDQGSWDHWAFFTSRTLDMKKFDDCNLSDEQFMGIGKTLVAALAAFRKVKPK